MEICPPCSSKPVMLFVLGPHRSGTSLTARMLECLGAHNSASLQSGDEFNPKGYFEDRDIREFNEEVLMPELRTAWHAVSPVDWALMSASKREQLQGQAVALIRKNYHETTLLSVLKEPRISTLLPFWLEALRSAGFAVKAVCPVRDPISVAMSLRTRNHLPLTSGTLIYFRAWASILEGLGTTPAVFVGFPDIVKDAEAMLGKISEVLQLPLPDDFQDRIGKFISSHLDPQLVHNDATQPESATPSAHLPPCSARLHALLSECTKNQDISAAKQFSQSAAADLGKDSCYLAALDEIASKHLKQHRENADLCSALALAGDAQERFGVENSRLSRELNKSAAENKTLQEGIAAISIRLKESDRQLAEVAAENKTLQEGIAAISIRLEESDRRLAEIRDSTCWRITKPARWLGDVCSSLRRLLRRMPLAASIFLRHGNTVLFDKEWYLSRNANVPRWAAFPHFCLVGIFRGYTPNGWYDEVFYMSRNAEVRQSSLSPLLHFVSRGFSNGLRAGLYDQRGLDLKEIPQADKATQTRNSSASELPDIRCIAFYLPQFHAIPENDSWWGKGFTEWTNVRRGKPYYEGHYQPHVPHRDVGYYDLNDPEVMEKQAEMARSAGIQGFCFYYYWFGGKRLLEMPTNRMRQTGRPDFPFCFCWANENWTRRWDGGDHEILVDQIHTADSDERFIFDLLPTFRDERYIRVEGKPLLLVYRPGLLPDPARTAAVWRRVCREEGIGEICLAYVQSFDCFAPETIGFDWAVQFPPAQVRALHAESPTTGFDADFQGKVFSYRSTANWYACDMDKPKLWPGVCPSWDNTARRMDLSHVWKGAKPEDYLIWTKEAVRHLRKTFPVAQRLLFVNAWNEWAEGCHLEPDEKYGYAWLEAMRAALAPGKPKAVHMRAQPAHISAAEISHL